MIRVSPDPKQGWVYQYERATRFIGAYHPEGGKQSILHFERQEMGDELGPVLVHLLNGTRPQQEAK